MSSTGARKEPGGPKVGGARLPHNLGGLSGNATLKDDFVFLVKALPSRIEGVAVIQRFELDWACVRSTVVHPFFVPHAGPRLGGFPALPITVSTTSAALLAVKGRSGASPHQVWAERGKPISL
ncbi:MAG: hypothetical protein WAK31_30055 [Chthoniobacterales bacterium]